MTEISLKELKRVLSLKSWKHSQENKITYFNLDDETKGNIKITATSIYYTSTIKTKKYNILIKFYKFIHWESSKFHEIFYCTYPCDPWHMEGVSIDKKDLQNLGVKKYYMGNRETLRILEETEPKLMEKFKNIDTSEIENL